MAVRLDIRPRLTLRDEPQAAVRRRFRLPPLALPAAGYWLAMGALTYVFAHLGEHPWDTASAAELATSEPAAVPPPTPLPAQPAIARAPEPAAVPDLPSAPELEPSPLLDPALAVAPESELERERPADRPTRSSADSQAGAQQTEPEPQPAARQPARVALEFPEFTDSSRPPERERASSGPRVDPFLFGKQDAPPAADDAPDSTPPPDRHPAPAAVSSCEAAIARNNEELRIGDKRGGPDISRGAFASVLENGRYLSSCAIPARTVFEICAAVRGGRAVGITVVSNPASPKLNACVRAAVSRLKFPENERLDVTHTRFDAAAR